MLVELLAALDWQTVYWWIDVILKVAVALGAVVFVHELGHFLMAKACGVKVEKFMIGFDIGGYKLSRRWGETVYGIGILPLGGYVKMFGQDDDPSHIAEQMQKSQVAATSADAVEKIGPNGEKYFIDRRSYLAKSVPQRMAIISAGVIMNVIFAFIFATIAYGMGVKYLPCIVSGTMPGSPAWKAGFMPGDEIVQLGEQTEPTFLQLRSGVTLGDLQSGIPCEVKRAATGEVVPMLLKPTQQEGELASVGIGGPLSLKLRVDRPVYPESAAAGAKLLTKLEQLKSTTATPGADKKDADPAKLRGGDTVESVGGVPVADYGQYIAELMKSVDKPLRLVVRRPLENAGRSAANASDKDAAGFELLEFEVPTQPMRSLGIVMKMGPITAVQDDSPAARAGVQPGDRIVAVDGLPSADAADSPEGWTPATLPEYLRLASTEGREIELTIRRGASKKSEGEELKLRMTPEMPRSMPSLVPLGAPMAADAVGVAYSIENEVHDVASSSPAAAAGVAAGDRIESATIRLPKDATTGETPPAQEVKLGRSHLNWPAILDALQFAPEGTQVELKLLRGEATELITVKLVPQSLSGVYVAPRGLDFEPIYRFRTAATFAEAVRFGFQETTEALTMVFRFLQKLGGQVPLKMLGGPGTIAVAAGDAASHGISALLIFLTMLSANLAVINFLPIPLLDGGHMVFLIYEGLRGRPANEKVVLGLHMAGFVFIIGLMIFVIGLDIHRWILT